MIAREGHQRRDARLCHLHSVAASASVGETDKNKLSNIDGCFQPFLLGNARLCSCLLWRIAGGLFLRGDFRMNFYHVQVERCSNNFL